MPLFCYLFIVRMKIDRDRCMKYDINLSHISNVFVGIYILLKFKGHAYDAINDI